MYLFPLYRKYIIIILVCNSFIWSSVIDFEQYITDEIKDKTPPSASFAILKGSKVVHIKSMGFTDRNMTQKTTNSSVYHVYSLTKILTTSLVMKLIEEKKIGLHDSIRKYFPNFDLRYEGKKVDVTILNLLNHSSGIGDRSDEIRRMFAQTKRDVFQALPYLPGSEAKYSNVEYIILGKVIEKVTGKDFETLIQKYILNPAKMKRSAFTYNSEIEETQVYGTLQFFSITGTVMRFMLKDESKDRYEGCMLWLKDFDIAWKPAGGLIASIDDMAKFMSAYHKNRLFSAKTKKLIFEQENVLVDSWMSSQDEVRFGIGWYHIRDKGKFFYQHQGLGPGFRTIMRIYPKYDVSIIILTSQTSIDIDLWADTLIEDIIAKDTLRL
jgi:CubicO group peptidase (beta-lactamase class C family)